MRAACPLRRASLAVLLVATTVATGVHSTTTAYDVSHCVTPLARLADCSWASRGVLTPASAVLPMNTTGLDVADVDLKSEDVVYALRVLLPSSSAELRTTVPLCVLSGAAKYRHAILPTWDAATGSVLQAISIAATLPRSFVACKPADVAAIAPPPSAGLPDSPVRKVTPDVAFVLPSQIKARGIPYLGQAELSESAALAASSSVDGDTKRTLVEQLKAEEKQEEENNKSFLQKYWHYIALFAVFMLLQGGGGGGGGGGEGGAAGGAPRARS